MSRRRAKSGVAVCLFLASAATGAFVACSSPAPVDPDFDAELPPNLPRDATTSSDAGDETDTTPPPPEPETDASPDACIGRADGFRYNPSNPTEGCCNERPVRLNSRSHCGACGIRCGGLHACTVAFGGRVTCECSGSNNECVNGGFGAAATCNDNLCNCNCGAEGTTCADQCSGGATCNDVTGVNFCSYP